MMLRLLNAAIQLIHLSKMKVNRISGSEEIESASDNEEQTAFSYEIYCSSDLHVSFFFPRVSERAISLLLVFPKALLSWLSLRTCMMLCHTMCIL